MSNADRHASPGPGDSKPRHPGTGMVPMFKCDRCLQRKLTTGRRRVNGALWFCAGCRG